VVSITICYLERQDIKYTWMPSHIYQNMVNLIVSPSIRRCPSNFMNVKMWDHFTLESQTFGCGKVYCSNFIIINNFI
jgi:hypothetical protein